MAIPAVAGNAALLSSFSRSSCWPGRTCTSVRPGIVGHGLPSRPGRRPSTSGLAALGLPEMSDRSSW